jgi:cytoskeletal protein CcmA (bactofilin family)
MAYASVVAGSAVIRGNVRGDTSLQILGRVEGDVAVSGDVSIGPEAVVLGAVSGARVVVAGSVEGDISASDAVLVEDSGRVVGDLAAPRIGVSEGAHIQGNVRTSGTPSGNSARAPAQRAPAESRAPAPAERPAPRPVAAAPVALAAVPSPAKSAPPKKAPPPPVIPAPRPGVRARKKLARR